MFYQFQHFGISEYFCKEYGENFNFPTHLHQSFELICVTSGEMKITVDDKLYHLKKGESVLVFPHQLHSISSQNSKHMLCIFSPELVKAYSSKILNKKPILNTVCLNKYLFDELDNLLDNSSSFEKKGILYSICAEFDKTAEYTKRLSCDESLLLNIFEFVEENYSGDCELQNLSQKTGYSYSYLSRCFKKITGISFNTYVNRYRISNACYLLNNSNCSILQCALDSGYKSVRSFNRNFMGVLDITPKEYRKKLKAIADKSI
ncbi:MAG: helix-turn-helix transcriptional regulator [Clostridia bacterium]|nr:helix-turn-helix transcriptional regulator [Clostridia bacterium]